MKGCPMVSTFLYFTLNICFLWFLINIGFFEEEKKKAAIIQMTFVVLFGMFILLFGILLHLSDKFEDWYYVHRNNKRN